MIVFIAVVGVALTNAAVDFRQVAHTGDPVVGLSSPIANFGHWVSINDQGQVALKVKLQDGSEAIVRADPNLAREYNLSNTALTTVIDTANGSSILFGDYVSINADGQVSYRRKVSAAGASFSIRRDTTRVAFGTSNDPYNWYFRGLMQPTDISTQGEGMVSFYAWSSTAIRFVTRSERVTVAILSSRTT